ncbi:MAG: D-alanyl-D-alanine carboxypeptidase family protein [Clostridia bacterium]|nr:D-alanyl-D-alanine carboxypeptidase family protein [Clostridia bacterium]
MNERKKINFVIAIVLVTIVITTAVPVTAGKGVFLFELPVEGATGFCSIDMTLYECFDKAVIVDTLVAGTPFTIKGESESMFFIDTIINNHEFYGWVDKYTTLINLPDIIPSIVYYDSNSNASLFKSSGVDLPHITGEQLYDCYTYNERFDEEQYVMPVLYDMACKIYLAQQAALKDGNSLKIYETYRPHSVQLNVCSTLSELMSNNSTVYNGISSWGKGWFISTGYSNHQRGRAMDVSLVKIDEMENRSSGDCDFSVVASYTEYVMPTEMHELSTKAITFKYAVGRDAWQTAPLSKGMQKSEGALLLQQYCTNAGMTPLASEWWHFDDTTCPDKCTGSFLIDTCLSETP